MEDNRQATYDILTKIIDKNFFVNLYEEDSFMASLMLETLKRFLSDSSYTDIERQLYLQTFLTNDYPLEICRDIVSYAKTCPLADDYTRVILEWFYRDSEYIKWVALQGLGAGPMSFSKKELLEYNKARKTKIPNLMLFLLNSTQDEDDDDEINDDD